MQEDEKKKAGLLQAFREFMTGMMLHEPSLAVLKEKRSLENLLLLALFGDLMGIPVCRSYYSLRLLPHVLPRVEGWKRSMLRQRDWTDWAFD